MTTALSSLDPLVIGGTGGSGTRAVAAIVRAGGAFIGERLNRALDQRDIADFHDRWIDEWLTRPDDVERQMRQELEGLLRAEIEESRGAPTWGWKCPTSLYLLPFFEAALPEFRFIHLVRDGRDMALSQNQNQLRKHGDAFLGRSGPVTPARSIALWAGANETAADFGERVLGDRYLRIRFEDLCRDPAAVVPGILEFAALDADPATCVDLVETPASIGRWERRSSAWSGALQRIAGPALERFGYVTSDRS